MTIIKARNGTTGFFRTFQNFPVVDGWQQELYNYFIEGWSPGSFHQACFENNLLHAANRTHSMNQWQDIVQFMKWINNNAPEGSWGNEENVARWLRLTPKQRFDVCYKKGWVSTADEITWEKVAGRPLVKHPQTGEIIG